MADKVEFEFIETGGEKLAGTLDAVAGSSAKADDGSKRLTTSLTKSAGAIADAGVKWTTFNGAIGVVARGIGTQNSVLGQMVGVIGQGVASIGMMSAAMGPLGIAIGLATTAFSIYEMHVASTKSKVDELRRSQEQLVPSLDEVISKIEEFNNRRERMGEIMGGRGTAAQRQGVRTVETNRLAADLERIRGTGPETDEIRRRVAEREALAATASEVFEAVATPLPGMVFTEEEAIAGERALGVRPPAANRRSGGRRQSRQPGGQGGVFDFTPTADASAESRASMTRQMNDQRELDDMARAAAEKQRSIEEEDRTQALAGLDETARREAEVHDQRMAQLEEWGAKGEEIAGAMYDAFMSVADGQATVQQAIQGLFVNYLRQTSKSETLEAGKQFAIALGYLAAENYPGAAKAAASGAAHLAVAAATGLGAAAIGSAGGGGSRAGGGARPTPGYGASRGSGGGGSSVVVNLNSPVVTAGTLADVGMGIARAVGAGIRLYGPSLRLTP